MLPRLLKPIRHERSNRFLFSSLKPRTFSTFQPRPGWRRRRFYRRLTVFSIGFTAWFFVVDADLITYSLDALRRHEKPSVSRALDGLTLSRTANSFKSKTVWIVGASSGIGEHIAYTLCSLKEPAPKRLILSARRGEELNRVANACNGINPMVDIVVKPLDITDFSTNSNFGDEFIGDIMDEIDDDIDMVVLNSGMIQVYSAFLSKKKLLCLHHGDDRNAEQSMRRCLRSRTWLRSTCLVRSGSLSPW